MSIYPEGLYFLKWTLRPLLQITDRCLFVLSRLTPDDMRGILPGDGIIRVDPTPYEYPSSMENGFRAVDEFRPDWVVYPSTDEILPVHRFPAVLEECAAGGYDGVMFPHRFPFGGFDYEIRPDLVRTKPHCAVVRWREGITCLKSRGYNLPDGFDKLLYQDEPLLHLFHMTEHARDIRREINKHLKCFDNPQLVPAPAGWQKYRVQQRGY